MEQGEQSSFIMLPIARDISSILSIPHSNSFYQIVILREGKGRYFIGLEQFDIVAPAICFIFPGQIFSLQLSENAEGDILMFDGTIFCSAILANELKEYNVDLHQKINFVDYRDNRAQFEKIGEMKKHIESLRYPLNNIREVELKFLTKIIIFKIIDSAPNYDFVGKQDYDLDSYIEYRKQIDEYFASDRKVESYCQRLGISAKKLNQLCKKFANNTALELIHERLSMEIKKRLIFEGASMKELSYELGFDSQSALNKYIATKFGCTPSQFKEKLRSENSMISSLAAIEP